MVWTPRLIVASLVGVAGLAIISPVPNVQWRAQAAIQDEKRIAKHSAGGNCNCVSISHARDKLERLRHVRIAMIGKHESDLLEMLRHDVETVYVICPGVRESCDVINSAERSTIELILQRRLNVAFGCIDARVIRYSRGIPKGDVVNRVMFCRACLIEGLRGGKAFPDQRRDELMRDTASLREYVLSGSDKPALQLAFNGSDVTDILVGMGTARGQRRL